MSKPKKFDRLRELIKEREWRSVKQLSVQDWSCSNCKLTHPLSLVHCSSCQSTNPSFLGVEDSANRIFDFRYGVPENMRVIMREQADPNDIAALTAALAEPTVKPSELAILASDLHRAVIPFSLVHLKDSSLALDLPSHSYLSCQISNSKLLNNYTVLFDFRVTAFPSPDAFYCLFSPVSSPSNSEERCGVYISHNGEISVWPGNVQLVQEQNEGEKESQTSHLVRPFHWHRVIISVNGLSSDDEFSIRCFLSGTPVCASSSSIDNFQLSSTCRFFDYSSPLSSLHTQIRFCQIKFLSLSPSEIASIPSMVLFSPPPSLGVDDAVNAVYDLTASKRLPQGMNLAGKKKLDWRKQEIKMKTTGDKEKEKDKNKVREEEAEKNKENVRDGHSSPSPTRLERSDSSGATESSSTAESQPSVDSSSHYRYSVEASDSSPDRAPSANDQTEEKQLITSSSSDIDSASPNQFIKCGIMNKLSGEPKRWKRRVLKLTASQFIYYIPSDGQAAESNVHKLSGSIQLAGASVALLPSESFNREFVFCITSAGHSNYFLEATSEAERLDWKSSIEVAIRDLASNKNSLSSSSGRASDVQSAAAAAAASIPSISSSSSHFPAACYYLRVPPGSYFQMHHELDLMNSPSPIRIQRNSANEAERGTFLYQPQHFINNFTLVLDLRMPKMPSKERPFTLFRCQLEPPKLQTVQTMSGAVNDWDPSNSDEHSIVLLHDGSIGISPS